MMKFTLTVVAALAGSILVGCVDQTQTSQPLKTDKDYAIEELERANELTPELRRQIEEAGRYTPEELEKRKARAKAEAEMRERDEARAKGVRFDPSYRPKIKVD